MLYVSHSPDEVARLADYLVALEGGKVLSAGPLADTLTRLDPLPFRLGEDAGAVLKEHKWAKWTRIGTWRAWISTVAVSGHAIRVCRSVAASGCVCWRGM